jgi:hypothetical protein
MVLDFLAGLLVDLVHQLEPAVNLLEVFFGKLPREEAEQLMLSLCKGGHVCSSLDKNPRGSPPGGSPG